jgi:hypothetical protein
MQSMAAVFAVELSVINAREAEAIERGITKIANSPNAGLLVTSSAPTAVHRDLIVRYFVTAGGAVHRHLIIGPMRPRPATGEFRHAPMAVRNV